MRTVAQIWVALAGLAWLAGCARDVAPPLARVAVPRVPGGGGVEPAAAPARVALDGVWREGFEGRERCDDELSFATVSGTLTLRSSNCVDGRPYAVEALSFDGRVLSAELRTSSGTRVRYELELEHPDLLHGEAEVLASDADEEESPPRYEVRWRRVGVPAYAR